MKRLDWPAFSFWAACGLIGVTTPCFASTHALAASHGQAARIHASRVPAARDDSSSKIDVDFLHLPAVELDYPSSGSASPVPHPTRYRVGDQIDLETPDVALPEGTKGPLSYALPQGSSPLNDQGWEILDQNAATALKITAVPIKGGKLTLPSLAIQDAAGKAIARTNPWTIDVESAIQKDDPAPEKPVDLKPPAELAFPVWAVVAMTGCALLILAAIGYWIYRWIRRRKTYSEKPVEPPKPEHEVALLALVQLENSGAVERGEYKRVYFGVSEILKNYIGARYVFDAPENTTRELLTNLREALERELSRDEKKIASLAALFELLDRVKFTDHVPPRDEAQKILQEAKDFVRQTRKVQAAVAAGGPDAIR